MAWQVYRKSLPFPWREVSPIPGGIGHQRDQRLISPMTECFVQCITCSTVPGSPVTVLVYFLIWQILFQILFPQNFFFSGWDWYSQMLSDLASVPWWQVGEAFHSLRNREELNTIASKPSRDHVFQVNNFEALKTIQNQLQEKIFAIEGKLKFCIHVAVPQVASYPQTWISPLVTRTS